jgi:competence protein ComEC
VLRALVIGDQSELSPELRDAYARTGTTHVLSVSGLHIAIVTLCALHGARWLLVRWSALATRFLVVRFAALIAIVPAVAYSFLAGAAIATLRSLVMGAVLLGGTVLLRQPSIETSLAAAVLVVCGLDPGALYDVSFQLSFASVVAIVVGVARLERSALRSWLRPRQGSSRLRRIAALVGSAVAVSAAATLGTAPFTLYYFGVTSLVGVLANVAVVPLVGGLAVVAGLVGAATLAVSAGVAALCFRLAGACILPANRLVLGLAAIPGAALTLAPPSTLEVATATALLLGLAARTKKRRALLLVVGLVACGDALFWSRERQASPLLRLRFLDVGQGDATLVELPRAGGVFVVDGGGLGGAFDTGERVVLPALWARKVATLEAVALSHPQRDHYGGLTAVVRRFHPRELWSNGESSPSGGFRALLQASAEEGARPRILARNDRPISPGVSGSIEARHPPAGRAGWRDNDASLVFSVRYGATQVLLTGDVQARAEREIVAGTKSLGSTIVKVPHHGSRTSSTSLFLDATQPGLAVAMLGARNRFGFPALEVVSRYASRGALFLRTDSSGEVEVESDGQLERVTTCRSSDG